MVKERTYTIYEFDNTIKDNFNTFILNYKNSNNKTFTKSIKKNKISFGYSDRAKIIKIKFKGSNTLLFDMSPTDYYIVYYNKTNPLIIKPIDSVVESEDD